MPRGAEVCCGVGAAQGQAVGLRISPMAPKAPQPYGTQSPAERLAQMSRSVLKLGTCSILPPPIPALPSGPTHLT